MAKDKEKSVARLLYVEHHLSQKEIADKVGVQEKTVSIWVNQNGWKEERHARINGPRKQVENFKKVIYNFTEKQLRLEEELQKAIEEKNTTIEHEINKKIAHVADEVSKWNKTLINFDKTNKISLETYLHVMDDIFSALQAEDYALHSTTVDFQEKHIQFISKKLG